MTVKVNVYDKSKYEVDSVKIAEVEYTDVACVDVFAGEQFREGYLDSFGHDLDPFNEYARIQFEDGEHSVFRNSFVDIFRVA